LDEDGGDSGENVFDLEKDMLLAFEEQEKSSSATALSSPQPLCRYTEQLSPQIDQEDDQGDTSHSRLNELGYSSSLREQDHGEEEPQQQQQEVAVQAVREDDSDDDSDDDDDDREQQERSGGIRTRLNKSILTSTILRTAVTVITQAARTRIRDLQSGGSFVSDVLAVLRRL
jgi:hypothetical protein